MSTRSATSRKSARAKPLHTGSPRDATPAIRVAIVVSSYNASITDKLLDGARKALSHRLPAAIADVFPAPGAFEVLTLSAAAAASGCYDAVVALGCIIKGETSHDHHLATAVTSGLAGLSINGGPFGPIPIGLGVLTVNSVKQARDRAGGRLGNKGQEAMNAALDTLSTLRLILSPADPDFADVIGSSFSSRPASALPDKARRRS